MMGLFPVACCTASMKAHMRVAMSAAEAASEVPVPRQVVSGLPVGHSMSSMGGRSSGPMAPTTERKCCACAAPSSVGSKKWYGLRMTPAALEPAQLAAKVDCVSYVPWVAFMMAKSTPAAFTDVQLILPCPLETSIPSTLTVSHCCSASAVVAVDSDDCGEAPHPAISA